MSKKGSVSGSSLRKKSILKVINKEVEETQKSVDKLQKEIIAIQSRVRYFL